MKTGHKLYTSHNLFTY